MSTFSNFRVLSGFAVALCLASVACASGTDEPASTTADHLISNNDDLPGLSWNNIATITTFGGYFDTGTPWSIPRPAAGNYVRVRVPSTCGFGTVNSLSGYDNWGAPIFASGVTSTVTWAETVFYWHVDSDASVEIRSLSVSLFTSGACTLTVEQARGYDWSPTPAGALPTMADCDSARRSVRVFGGPPPYVFSSIGVAPPGRGECSVVIGFRDAEQQQQFELSNRVSLVGDSIRVRRTSPSRGEVDVYLEKLIVGEARPFGSPAVR